MLPDDPADVPSSPAVPPATTGAEAESNHLYPVVGVGASAGGLEAITELLQNLSPDPGLAFLLAVHLDPHHKSHLPEILRNVTPLNVHEVKEGMPVEINNVYLIPPNTNMALTDGRLALTPRKATPGTHMPIDHLFRSLAEIQKQPGRRRRPVRRRHRRHARPAGHQGRGRHHLRPGREVGQANQHAAQRRPRRQRRLRAAARRHRPRADAHRPPSLRPRADPGRSKPAPTEDSNVADILALLRAALGVDFTHYKQTTIKRRILRRMALRGMEQPGDYLHFLQDDADELQLLYQDFLIRVTQFFRDPEAFEALKDKVFPALAKGRSADNPIRIWVAGCSTGEEVYSLAIALLEYLESQAGNRRHQDPGHRPQRVRPGEGPRRRLPRQHRDRRVAGAAAALLRPPGRPLPDQQGRPRAVRLLAAQPGQRPAVQPPRPGQLPQRADLHGHRSCRSACCRSCTTP